MYLVYGRDKIFSSQESRGLAPKPGVLLCDLEESRETFRYFIFISTKIRLITLFLAAPQDC